MTRLALLSISLGIVFVGFAIPFFVPDTKGLLFGAAAILAGAVLTAVTEIRTAKWLDEDSAWNRFINKHE